MSNIYFPHHLFPEERPRIAKRHGYYQCWRSQWFPLAFGQGISPAIAWFNWRVAVKEIYGVGVGDAR